MLGASALMVRYSVMVTGSLTGEDAGCSSMSTTTISGSEVVLMEEEEEIESES